MFYLTKKPFKSLKIIEFQYLKCFEKIIWLWEGMGVGTGGGNKVIQLFSHSNFEKILTIFLPDIKLTFCIIIVYQSSSKFSISFFTKAFS